MVSALTATALTLVDWAKRRDPNGAIPKIVELLSQTNEMLDDALFMEGNLPTGHLTTVRTGLPTVYWRMINQYIPTSKSTTAQITEATGMLEAWSSVDPQLAKLSGDEKAFRLSEASAFLEAMNQEMQGTVIYGNGGTAPEEFTGLAPRYSSLSAGNADNIISCGGSSTDNYSIWLVVWGANTCFLTFPKGSKAGLEHENIGLDTETDSSGYKRRSLLDRWMWHCGLVLKDWRYVVRLCNIDVSDLVGITSAPALQYYMSKAIYRIPNIRAGKAAFYMNRTCAEYLDHQERADVKSGGGLTYENVNGKRVMSFREVPIRIVDQLVTETTAVS
jgi:hypothetical protein